MLFLVVMPISNMLSLRSGAINGTVGVNVPPGFRNMSGDPNELMRDFLLPLFITLAGLVMPSITATHTIIGERERRTLELLVALPVSLGQIVLSKLLAVLLLGAAISLPLFIITSGVMIAAGIGSYTYALALLFLLASTLLYSTASALVVGLLAADFRTANNLNGAFLGPIILVTLGATMALPGGLLNPILLGLGYIALACVLTAIGLRTITVERFLR
jgi:ABC-type Na+ efflux pump permease subunit